MFFEVGLAFLFAWYGVKHGHLGRKDAEGYGSALAFWENAAFLGLLPLINLVTYYGILSTNTPVATTLYNQLQTNAPGLFAPASQALGSVAIGIMGANFINHDSLRLGLPLHYGGCLQQKTVIPDCFAHGLGGFSGAFCISRQLDSF